MSFAEQILYGIDVSEPAEGNHVLAQSPGVSHDAVQEITTLCEHWGSYPVLGMSHPALMSFPLSASMVSLGSSLYAVIRVSAGQVPVFHALIINDKDYSRFRHNPFALVELFQQRAVLAPGQFLPRVELNAANGSQVIVPPPSPEDVGIVDLIVEQILVEGRFLLPLEQGTQNSDRTLSLVLTAMPQGFLRNLRFASYAPGQSNNYTLASLHTSGSTISGWKRLLLAKVTVKTSSQNNSYVHKVRSLLEIGDLSGLKNLDMKPQSKRAPVIPQPVKPKAEIVTAGSNLRIQPTASISGVNKKSRGPRKKMAGNRPKSSRRGDKNLSRFLIMILGVVLVGSGGMWWWQQYDFSGLDAWSRSPGSAQGEEPKVKAQTLLEVVDSGKVYDRLVMKLAQASLGQVEPPSRDRFKALTTLQSRAAEPLVKQAQLFLKLAGDGIQQSNRQDREADRLQALATQGAVLESELKRLELAWFSLSSSTDWRDLGKLSDKNVSVRRDSLAKNNSHSLEIAAQELGTSDLVIKVAAARTEADGMARLLDLFRASSWSQQWEDELPSAANKVSPSASRLTRAYRNSAYTLVGLKEAEKASMVGKMAFSEKFGTEAWLPFEVVELLPSLRRQVRRFPRGEAPVILSGTLDLYAALEKSSQNESSGEMGSEELKKLSDNEALQFHPAVYGDIVQRIRFEAAKNQLKQGKNPADVPDVFFPEGDRDATVEFLSSLEDGLNQGDWEALANSSNRAFFRRWALANSKLAGKKHENLLKSFESDWLRVKQLTSVVSAMANEGRDWTAQWHDLRDQVKAMQKKYPPSWAFNSPLSSTRIQMLGSLASRLNYDGRVAINGVVVRLGSDVVTESNEVVVHLEKDNGSPVVAPFVVLLGPAAPAGSGWVGTGNLDLQFELSQNEVLVARVEDAVSGDLLQKVTYDSLSRRVGFGALTRTKILDNGSLSFKADTGYWQGLSLPTLQ